MSLYVQNEKFQSMLDRTYEHLRLGKPVPYTFVNPTDTITMPTNGILIVQIEDYVDGYFHKKGRKWTPMCPIMGDILIGWSKNNNKND